MRSGRWVLLMAGFVGALSASPGNTAPIVVPNSSFESPDVLDATSIAGPPAGWSFTKNLGSFGVSEIFNPQNASYSGTTGAGVLPGTGDAEQLTSISNADGQISGEWSLTTTGSLATVTDNTAYTLTVALGNRKVATPFEFSFVELLVNGAVVASTAVGRASIVEDTFTDFSTGFATGTGDPLTGGSLAVRLRVTESQFFVLGLTDFDNVRLDATAVTPPSTSVPEPAPAILLVIGAVGALVTRRRLTPRG